MTGVCYKRLINVSLMVIDGRMFCFTSTATIKQLLELLLKKIKDTKVMKERKGKR
jgi:hypothetical protein